MKKWPLIALSLVGFIDKSQADEGVATVTVAPFYWHAHEGGLKYALEVNAPLPPLDPTSIEVQQLNQLSGSRSLDPDFKWNFGFKLGVGYKTSRCDGWDIGAIWTWFHGNAHVNANSSQTHTLLPLWSAFTPPVGALLYAAQIEGNWKLHLNLIDLQLGHEFWSDCALNFRPYIGVRGAFITQDYELKHSGGSWNSSSTAAPLIGHLNLQNHFKGVGPLIGLNSLWKWDENWGIYGTIAGSWMFGKFHLENNEKNVPVSSPFVETLITHSVECVKETKTIFDWDLGLRWSTYFNECCYQFIAGLAWEGHLFFNQNQFWRIVRIGDLPVEQSVSLGEIPFNQGHGTLILQGVTLTLQFEF